MSAEGVACRSLATRAQGICEESGHKTCSGWRAAPKAGRRRLGARKVLWDTDPRTLPIYRFYEPREREWGKKREQAADDEEEWRARAPGATAARAGGVGT